MAAKFVVFLACVALGSGAVVKREAGADAGSTLLDIMVKHAGELQKTFNEQLNQISSTKNVEAVQKELKSGTDSLLQQLSSFSASLQSAAGDANGKAKEALQAALDSLNKVSTELRAQHPEIEQNANALKEKLQAAVQGVSQETQKLAQQVSANVQQGNEKLAPKLKAAYDDFVKQVQEVQKNLHETANKQ